MALIGVAAATRRRVVVVRRFAGAALLLSLRLRIELGRITEIESVYFRSGGAGPNNIPAMARHQYVP